MVRVGVPEIGHGPAPLYGGETVPANTSAAGRGRPAETMTAQRFPPQAEAGVGVGGQDPTPRLKA
jgi:hypothetical protein